MKKAGVDNFAPIVLFTYNRPHHLQKTLEALKQNELAPSSILHIYSDGPKEDKQEDNRKRISEVRELIRKEQWCGEVRIIEYEANKGLAASIKTGVNEVIQRYGRVIVLEDDLVTSPFFLNYMNEALDFYENRKAVFSISGYCLPPNKLRIPLDYPYDVFVSLRNSSWGWATWTDRWNQIDWNINAYESIHSDPNIKEAFNRGGDDVFGLLESLKTGKLDIWSIQFTLAHFVNHAVSIVPVQSFIDNIGLDGSGENCRPSYSLKNMQLCKKKEYKFLDVLYEDKRLINSFYNAYCHKKRALWQKTINQIARNLGFNKIFLIKKKIYY
jgi:hypothetical protein